MASKNQEKWADKFVVRKWLCVRFVFSFFGSRVEEKGKTS